MLIVEMLLFILPLGVDTFGVSVGLGIKSSSVHSHESKESGIFPYWLRQALVFAFAEMLMPLVGLLIGYTASLIVSDIMHYIGALLLIGLGARELWEEAREYLGKEQEDREDEESKESIKSLQASSSSLSQQKRVQWRQQALLALSISMDELAVGFSLGSVTHGRDINPLTLCLFIGLQGFLVTVLGLSLGRLLRVRLKVLKEWSEVVSAVLLIGLGVWLLVS